MNLINILKLGVEKNASDIHIVAGMPPILRINGNLKAIKEDLLDPETTKSMVHKILKNNMISELEKKGEVDTSFTLSDISRYRVNAFKQKDNYGMVLRIIPLKIPTMEELKLPNSIKELTSLKKGLVLVTGPTGCGKSTTLASLINQINKKKCLHILTLEDPIEYIHENNKSIVNQREIGKDSLSFASALRSSLRQDPDIILIGEMRDLETISIALTAAETGHLVLSTLHTSGAAKTIDRIIDAFNPNHQNQIRTQLSSVLEAIISQQLLPGKGNTKRIGAFEIMRKTNAISNLIRDDKVYQIDSAIQTGTSIGMISMDKYIIDLYKKDLIDKETLSNGSIDKRLMEKNIIQEGFYDI